MRFGPFHRFLAYPLLLLWLLAATGCVSDIAANRIVNAPNSHRPIWDEKTISNVWHTVSLQRTNNPITFLSIPVGPPEAKLKIAALPPGDYRMKITSSVSTNRNGKYCLAASCTPQTNDCSFTPLKTPATIFILHGYTLTKETMLPWAFTLTQAGYRVILVDLRGHGQSTGSQVSFGKIETTDLTQLLDQLTAQHLCDEQVGVLGLSYGATLALHWAAHDSRIRTVVAMEPYNQPDEAIVRFAEEMKIPIPQSIVRKATVTAAKKMDLQWTDWSAETAMHQVKVPVLFIGGAKDTISRPEDLQHLKQLATDDSQLIEIPIANHIVLAAWYHGLSDPIKNWFNDHLTPASPATPIAQKN
jgi:pimeloyl-ACP methyl ester carboxylesterase